MGEGSRGSGRRAAAAESSVTSKLADAEKEPRLLRLFVEVWPFVRPQRWLLLFGLLLMAINRMAGLVLPGSTKFLIDNVIGKREAKMMVPLIMAVLAATAVQGVTSYSLTQLL